MDKNKKKRYVKPEVRRVQLSLAEITLGTGCDTGNIAIETGNCGVFGSCDTT